MDRDFSEKDSIVKASIDIGTNTVLLLVAEVNDGQLEVICEEQRVPRLGQGVDDAKHLSTEAMERVIEALKEYQFIIDNKFPSVSTIRVTATSAVRDAQNREAFIHLVEEQTGLTVEVLSGFEEAKFTFLGAQSVLEDNHLNQQKVIIDIGGGSTEIATGNEQQLGDRYSYDMGCVRFTERFLRNDPPSSSQVQACRNEIRRMLKHYEFNFVDKTMLIGVAGTVTSLAFIDKGLDSYSSAALAGYTISIETLDDYIKKFQQLSSDVLFQQYPEVLEGRADIFLAGLLILKEFMRKYEFEQVITSTGGIRHGALLAG